MSTISLFFLLHQILIIVSFLGHSSVVAVRADGDLISGTCSQTPYTVLCVSSLQSDPKSSAAGLEELALIMIDAVKAKASETLQVIKKQLKNKPELKKPLSFCVSAYEAILTADIPSSIQAVKLGNPKFGESGMTDAANEASYCEDGFQGKSTISSYNKVVHDTSTISAAIVRQLL